MTHPFTLIELDRLHKAGEKIAMLTCYDASFAALAEMAGVEMLLVGDSLGMVIQGHTTTLPDTLDETAYHVRAVAALGAQWSLRTCRSEPIRRATRPLSPTPPVCLPPVHTW